MPATPEQAHELVEILFKGDGSDPWPEWLCALSSAEKAQAIVAAEATICPWAYTTDEIKRRTAELSASYCDSHTFATSSTSSHSLTNTRLTAAN